MDRNIDDVCLRHMEQWHAHKADSAAVALTVTALNRRRPERVV